MKNKEESSIDSLRGKSSSSAQQHLLASQRDETTSSRSRPGLNNAWLQHQGLLGMKTFWAELAPLRRTA